MLDIETIKIGTDIYNINYDAEMTMDNAIGQISGATCEIRIRKISPMNTPIPERQVFKTLMHEIIHAIDHIIFWNLEEDDREIEIAIELFSEFVIDNIDVFTSKTIEFEDFVEYCEMTEIKMKRHFMFFNMINRVIEDNVELFLMYLEEFGEEE